MNFDYLSLIFSDIKSRKFSSFLTFFAISLGILSIFVIILVSQGFQQSIQDQFEKMGSNRLIISASGGNTFAGKFQKGLTSNEVKLLESKPYISDVQPMIQKKTSIKYLNQIVQSPILGVPFTKAYFDDYNIEIETGRFPKNTDKYSIILGPEAAKNLFNKEVKVGSNLYINNTKFKVIGILKSVGNPSDDSQIYTSIDTIRNIFNLGNQVDVVFAKVTAGIDVNQASSNTKILLENKLGKDTVNVQTFDQLLGQVNSILSIVQMTLGGIALVSLLIGAVGIINTMFVIITEKTKEIGIMKAIGATNFDIFSIYVMHSGIFGTIGALIGVIFGSLIAIGFGSWAKNNGYSFLTITVTPTAVISLLLFGFLIGVIAGFIPAKQASKLLIVETLRK